MHIFAGDSVEEERSGQDQLLECLLTKVAGVCILDVFHEIIVLADFLAFMFPEILQKTKKLLWTVLRDIFTSL